RAARARDRQQGRAGAHGGMNRPPPADAPPAGGNPRDGALLAELEQAAADPARTADQRTLLSRAASAVRGARDEALVELRFREVVENVQQGIVVRDHAGIVVYVNSEALRMFDQRPVADAPFPGGGPERSEEHTSELQLRENLVCRLL